MKTLALLQIRNLRHTFALCGSAAAILLASAGPAQTAEAPGTRKAAQSELESLPLDQYDTLKQRAAAESDPKVKSGLQAALEAMKRAKFLLGAPLTIDVSNAPLPEVVQALNKGLNAELIKAGARDSGDARFTLSARQRPLWEIISQLDAQAPLRFTDFPDSCMTIDVFQPSAANTNRIGMLRATYAIGQFGATKANVLPATAAGGPSLTVRVMFDPRIWVVRSQTPLPLTSAVDNLKQAVLPAGGLSRVGAVTDFPFAAGFGCPLQLPASPGTSISKAATTARLFVVARQDHLVIEKIPDQLNKPITWAPGAGELTINSLEKEGDSVTLTAIINQSSPPQRASQSLDVARREMRIDAPRQGPVPHMPIRLRLIDENGYASQFVNNVHTPSIPDTPPRLTLTTKSGVQALKLEISWPTQIEEITLPVEVQDVLLPEPRNYPTGRSGAGG